MRVYVFCCLFLLSGSLYSRTEAQFLKKLGEKIEKSVDRRIDRRTDQAVEKSLDKVESGIANAVNCAVGDDACIAEAQKQGKPVAVIDEQGNVVKEIPAEKGQEPDKSKKTKQEVSINTNYDFEPGERTIFATEFAKNRIGNFPQKLEFVRGNFETVERNGEILGRATSRDTKFAINLHEKLTERFTIQLRLTDACWLDEAVVSTSEKIEKGETYFRIYNRRGVGVVTRDGPSSTGDPGRLTKELLPVEIMVDGSYAKMYVDGRRVANIPQTNIKRTDKLYFKLGAGTKPEDYIYLGDIRIAAGGNSLYQTIEKEGRVAIHDILFATGSAKIKPASEEELQKIAKLLQEHPDLILLIEGHKIGR